MKKSNRAVFLDRDGTLIRERHYLSDPAKLSLFQGAPSALKDLRKAGWKLILVTNQSGLARGYFKLADLRRVHEALRRRLQQSGVRLDAIYVCPHGPRSRCSCRKPKPGLLRRAARDFGLDLKKCIMVGDKRADIRAGRSAGTKTVLVRTGYGRKQKGFSEKPGRHFQAAGLAQAVRWILKTSNERKN